MQSTVIYSVLTKPELKYTANKQAITNLSIATTKVWVDKDSGEKKQTTQWHRVSVFGKSAEIANKYCTKGTKVYIEGELQTSKYQDRATGIALSYVPFPNVSMD